MTPSLSRLLVRSCAVLLSTALVLFASAGTFHWGNAWAFLLFMAVIAFLTGSLFQKAPDLAEERGKAGPQARPVDRILVALIGGILPFLALILAGLDKRWAWTRSINPALSILAALVAIPSIALTFWAMQSNPFFSSHVRIQKDRRQFVVKAGPYRYVRHPGYSGAILYNLAVPLLLGSLAALGVGLGIVALTVLRTSLEDRTLQKELAGYSEYAEKVRYRLVPFFW